MNLATRKLNLIEQLMKIDTEELLDRVEHILTQAEMESRAHESLQAISKGETTTLEEFAQENRTWLKKRSTK